LTAFKSLLQWQRLFGTFKPLRKCDFTGKFSANGTRVEIKKTSKNVLHQGVSGHMELSQHTVQIL